MITPYYAKNKIEYFKFLKNIDLLKKTNTKQIEKAKKILYFFESGNFITKKITCDQIRKDKTAKNFFLNKYGVGLNINKYFDLIHDMLSKDINKSKVFKKLVELV